MHKSTDIFTEDTGISLLDEQEVLGKQFKVYGTPENPLFFAKNVAEWIDYDTSSVNKMIADVDAEEKVRKKVPTLGGMQESWMLTEDGLYEVLMSSHKPIAKQFKKKVKEILKTLRRTGGYVANEDLFIATYLPYADDQMKEMFKAILVTTRKQNETIKKQRAEIEHKEDVIIGLVDDISLAEKRQILNRVVRYNHANYRERWAMLYREFENKYHIDLQYRFDKYNSENKPKCKTKLEYIDRGMGKLPELYEIAAKLFENDVKALVDEMYEIAS